MSNWKEYKLEDALECLIYYRGKTPEKTISGIPLITAKIVKKGKIETPTEFIAKENYKSWMVRGLPKVGDIVLTTEAPLGEVAQLDNCNVALAQRIVTLRGKKDLLDNDFLLYLLQSDFIQHQLEARSSGSTVKGIKQSELRKIILKFPSLAKQKEIALKIKILDKKIQLNTQINQTLEQIAQALFKSWFVDFDPVRAKVQALSDGLSLEQAELAAMQAISGKTPEKLTALSQTQPDRYAELAETAKAFPCEMVEVDGVEVPKGWEIKPLGDLISFVKGKKPKAVSPNQEENMLPHILTSSLEGKYNEFCESNKLITVEYQNTIMLMDGSNSGRIAIGHNGVIGSTLAKINLDNNKLWAVIYQFLKHKEADIQANTTGTTIPHTDKNRVNNYLMTIPNDFLLDKFTELFDNSLLKIISNRNQIISLETIRDLLLPRLLNGEINV